MKEIKLTREELFEMVWREPLTVISKRYHITYAELRKIYFELNIPVPDGGHWSKLQWGKPVTVSMLPPCTNCQNDVILNVREPDDLDVIIDKVETEEVCNTVSIFKVPGRLTNPDILITKTREYFEAVKRYDWRRNEKYPEKKDILSIDVQYCNLPRALRIFDTIIKILKSRGYDISFGWRGTLAIVYGQNVGMKLREINKVSTKPRERYSSRELDPTGRLSFQIGEYEVRTVNDGREPLEEKIDTIIYKIEAEGKKWHDWHVQVEIREKERQEQLRIEREARARKEKELSDFKSLYILANRLHQANIMRNYISLIEINAQNIGNDTTELRPWLEWARKKIDWYDPLICGTDDTFTVDDKSTIFQNLIQHK